VFHRNRYSTWVFLAACLGALCLAGPARAEPATLTLDDIIRGLQATEERWLKLENWMIHYWHVRDLKDPAPGTDAEFPPMEKVNARKGKVFYAYEKQGLSRKANPHADPNTKVETWVLWKDGVCLERHNDNVSVLPEPSTIAYQMYFFTGWLFLDLQQDMEVRSEYLRKIYKSNRPSDVMADYILPRCLVTYRSEYRVRPQLEMVDGHPCHVLERPNHDVIWIDPAINFMARRRLVYKPAGHLGADITHTDYQQKAPGIWIPSRSKSLAYNGHTAPEAYRTKVRDVAQNVLVTARFNDVPDSVYNVPVPDGVRVHDYIRGYTYEKTRPEADPLQRGLEAARRDLEISAPPRRRDWLRLGLLGAIGVQLLVTAFCLLSRGRRANPTPEADTADNPSPELSKVD
jgi:hypothetical protein